VRYLLSRQEADEMWRSVLYGYLRSGDALTPLVLSVLLESGARRCAKTAAARPTTPRWQLLAG
jgi:hypothetical protein